MNEHVDNNYSGYVYYARTVSDDVLGINKSS